MPEEIKPIKRSNELAPLSRDHHEGLMLVWKIRKGIKNNITPGRISSYCHWFWDHHLHTHFKEEEELLVDVLPGEHPLMQQMFAEHVAIKALLDKMNREEDYELFEQFAQTLNDHIRFEERILFNEIEKAATPEQLQKIATHLREEEHCPAWPDEFWKTA